MTDQQPVPEIVIDEKTYPIGSILERPGKTAKVLGISMDKTDKKKFRGYHCLFTTVAVDSTVRESQGLLRVDDLKVPAERGGWKLKKVEAAPMQDEIAALEVEAAPADTSSSTDTAPLQAISDLAAARLVEIADLKRLLELNHQEFEALTEKWLDAVERVTQLEQEKEDLIEARDSAIAHNAAASDYRAELADEAATPCREYKTVTAISDADLAKYDREKWVTVHMQFDGTKLNVVYARYIPAPTAPETTRRAVNAIPDTHVVIQPVEAATPPQSATERMADVMADVFAVGEAAYNAAMAASPIPNFHPLSLPVGAQS